MTNDQKTDIIAQKEHTAELLKERIYATLALLAILVSIDPEHYTPVTAAILIVGTIVSLWAASLIAAQMSRRIVFQGELNLLVERERQLREHSPMLATLIFPLLMLSLSYLELISLPIAINVSIASAFILLASWSVLSAKSLHVTKLPLFILVTVELAIGLGVVALKVIIGH